MYFKLISAFFCLTATLVTAQDRIENVAFIKLGSYSINGFHGKDYFIPRHTRLTWSNTRSFCNSHGMDLLAIDTKDEELSILDMCERQIELFDVENYIGGIATRLGSADSWYWARSGNRIIFPLKWGYGEPNNYYGEEWCLSIKEYSGEFFINDHSCDQLPFKFICQQETFG